MKEKLFIKHNIYMMLIACLIPLFVIFCMDANQTVKIVSSFIPPTLILYCYYMDDIRRCRLKGLRLSELMLGCGIGISIYIIIMNAFKGDLEIYNLVLCLIMHLCVLMILMGVLKVMHRIEDKREREKPFPSLK